MPHVETNGISTFYTRTGDGPPLVLLHGGEADHHMFDALTAELAPHLTVIAYDQRDCGATRNGSEPYGLDDLADDAAALIAALGFDRAGVYGTSLGGLIGQAVAARHRNRVEKLILGSTWRVGRSPIEVNANVFRTLAALRTDTATNAPKIAEYFFAHEFIAARPEVVEIFRGGSRDEGQRARRGAVALLPAEAPLSGFTAPTLLLAGSEDRLIPPAATFALQSELPQAEARTLAGVSHVGAIQAPAQIAAAILAFFGIGQV
ncbi:alpha/beta fold hydrolase [Chelatococcus reniformis]|uniref:Alpha/beta hydrolase n=1 Tax=Chelatococcus reniformis TaxID=1494448 RepID=A0A916U5P9_9HYPH|nr:alpha/beta hydrolase [Chelatococcus reniformis]GGC61190.1 alpha/beta hydrolase [Chelatococcus reniformis]